MSDGIAGCWRREGLLLGVKPGHEWWVSHAQLPTVLPLNDRLWRIFFAARDRENVGRILAVDVDPSDRMRVVAEHFEPLIELGPLGSFDQAGMSPSGVVAVAGQVRLYYNGLHLRRDVRAVAAIGLAVSEDGLHFRRAFAGPVLGMGPFDPFLSVSPFVQAEGGGFRMWYVGGTEWRLSGAQPEPSYAIRVARSRDGLFWDQRTEQAVATGPSEMGLARPWISPTSDGDRLWLSRRGEAFRSAGADAYHVAEAPIDAEGVVAGSPTPIAFENPPQPQDFDSWMQAYGCIVPHGPDLLMVYNGNDFGKAGFGWARRAGAAARRGAD